MKASDPAALFRKQTPIFIEKECASTLEALWALWIRENFLASVDIDIQTTNRSACSLSAVLTSLSGLHVR
jgi:hypothetical protein